jgi:hypothetical protein
MRIFKNAAFLGLCFCFCACVSNNTNCNTDFLDNETVNLVRTISNNDIIWDANYFGLEPRIWGPSAEVLRLNDHRLNAVLIDALNDRGRFVAAHVLLSYLNESIPRDASAWNGLRVDIDSHGRVDIPERQRFRLIRQWQSFVNKCNQKKK